MSVVPFKSITVFCGSSMGNDPVYAEQAFLLGKTLAEQGIDLVYGGARVGIMGSVAEGALSEGGRVLGILPRFLQTREIAHRGLTELKLVESMHERKKLMNDLADGFIALPGGFGTLEEFFETLTWGQLGLHQKPMGLLNIRSFFDPLCAQVQTMVDQGFLKAANRDMMLISETIDELLDRMSNFVPEGVPKWITEEGV